MKNLRLSSALFLLAPVLILTACATSPEDTQKSAVLTTQGKALLATRQTEQARNVYSDATTIDPMNARAWNGLGVAEDMLGNNADALEDYKRASELAPNDMSIANNLGHAYLVAGEPAMAVHVLQPFTGNTDAPAALRQNLELAITQVRAQQNFANGNYADLGSSPTEGMAQAHLSEAKSMIGAMSSELVFVIDPDNQVLGGNPVYTIKVTGLPSQKICDIYNAKAFPCITHGK